MKILVVDDSRTMRTLVMRALRACNLKEPTFFVASSGVEALEECSRRKHDLVVTDLHMAEFDGIALITTLKAQSPQLLCGMCTAESHPDVLEAAKRAGAAFVVHKPFSTEDWMEALKPLRKRHS